MPVKPNVVIMLSDNQRWDAVGRHEGTACQTPTLDRIAREGVYFSRLRCSSPICSPARAAFFTGYEPHQAGMPHLPSATPSTAGSAITAEMQITKPAFTQRLRELGYKAYMAGKWHLGRHNVRDYFDYAGGSDEYGKDYGEWCRQNGLPEGRIFNREGVNPYRSQRPPGMSIPLPGLSDMPPGTDWDAWTVDIALKFLDQVDAEQPFVLVCNTRGPHQPLVVQPEYFDMYDPSQIPEPPNFRPTKGEPGFLKDSYFRQLWSDFGTDFDAWRKSIAVYWGLTTYIDSLFGKVVDKLQQRGLLDNTLVVMSSDHGDMGGQHGLMHKEAPYEENLRVPLAMRLPGTIAPNSVVTNDISQIDIAPTIMGILGLDPDSNWEGENLLPYVSDLRSPARRDCFSQYNLGPDWKFHGVENWRLLVRHPWKYVYHEFSSPELYNLEVDPFELENVSGKGAEEKRVERELSQATLEWMERTGDPLFDRISVAKVSGGAPV